MVSSSAVGVDQLVVEGARWDDLIEFVNTRLAAGEITEAEAESKRANITRTRADREHLIRQAREVTGDETKIFTNSELLGASAIVEARAQGMTLAEYYASLRPKPDKHNSMPRNPRMSTQEKLDFYADLVQREKQYPGGYQCRREQLVRVLWAETHPLNPYPELLPPGAGSAFTAEQLGAVWFPVAASEAGLNDEEVQFVKPAAGAVAYEADGPHFSLPWEADFDEVGSAAFSYDDSTNDVPLHDRDDYADIWRAMSPYDRWRQPVPAYEPAEWRFGKLAPPVSVPDPVGLLPEGFKPWRFIGRTTTEVEDSGAVFVDAHGIAVPGPYYYWDLTDDSDIEEYGAISKDMIAAITRLWACLLMDNHHDLPEIVARPDSGYVLKTVEDVQKYLELVKHAAIAVVLDDWRISNVDDSDSEPDPELTLRDIHLPDIVDRLIANPNPKAYSRFEGWIIDPLTGTPIG